MYLPTTPAPIRCSRFNYRLGNEPENAAVVLLGFGADRQWLTVTAERFPTHLALMQTASDILITGR